MFTEMMMSSNGGGSALKNINDWVVVDTAKTGSTTVTFTLQPNLKNKIYAFKADSGGSSAFNRYAIGDNASALFINKASDALLFIDEDGNSYYQTFSYFEPYESYTMPTYDKTTGLVSCTQRAATYATIIAEVM